MPFLGGISETKPANNEVQALCNLLQAEIEGRCGKNFSQFAAISYATQVVAGIQYFIKICTDDGYIHVRIYEPLPYANKVPSVLAIQQGKDKDDAITSF